MLCCDNKSKEKAVHFLRKTAYGLFGKTTANRVSRFIDEIPDEHIEKRNIPRGYGFGEKSTVQREYGQRPSYQTKSRPVSGSGCRLRQSLLPHRRLRSARGSDTVLSATDR